MATLKKQLQEKEQAFHQESTNLDAAKARLRELRLELDQEKIKQNSLQNKNVQQQQELQGWSARLQQSFEANRIELSNLQKKMQTKFNDEKNIAIQRVQEENNRLHQALQQLESDRARPEVLTQLQLEIEQLRNERQQLDRRQVVQQQTNDDLRRQVQQLEERLQQVGVNRQKEDYAFQQQLNELTSQMQQTELGRASLAEELNKTCNKCNNLEGENVALKKKTDQLLVEKEDVVNQFQTKLNELGKAKSALEDTLNKEREAREQVAAKDASVVVSNGNSEKYDKLQEGLAKSAIDIEKLQQEVIEQQKKNDELRDANSKAVEALNQAEKVSTERLAIALNEAEKNVQIELKSALDSRKEVAQHVILLENERSQLLKERELLVKAIERYDTNASSASVESLVSSVNKLIDEHASNLSSGSNSQEEHTILKERLSEESEKVERLEAQLENYKSTLSETVSN